MRSPLGQLGLAGDTIPRLHEILLEEPSTSDPILYMAYRLIQWNTCHPVPLTILAQGGRGIFTNFSPLTLMHAIAASRGVRGAASSALALVADLEIARLRRVRDRRIALAAPPGHSARGYSAAARVLGLFRACCFLGCLVVRAWLRRLDHLRVTDFAHHAADLRPFMRLIHFVAVEELAQQRPSGLGGPLVSAVSPRSTGRTLWGPDGRLRWQV